MGVMLSLAAQGSVQLKQYGSTDAVQGPAGRCWCLAAGLLTAAGGGLQWERLSGV